MRKEKDTVKVLVSLPSRALHELDRLAERLNESRSGTILQMIMMVSAFDKDKRLRVTITGMMKELIK